MGGSTKTRTGGHVRAHAPARVTADVVLPVSAELASDRLLQVFHAAGRGGQVLMSVGPGRRTHRVSKQVRAGLTRAGRRGSTEVFDLHWEPVGATAAAYPSLEGRLGVTPVDISSSLLSVVAGYRPPLGPVGAGLDRAALYRLADATVESVLRRLADAIAHPSRPVVRSVTS